MTRKWRVGMLALAVSCCVATGNGAGPVTFDFENNNVGTFTPFTQSAGGVTATFSVQSGPGYSVQNAASTMFVLSQFSGNFLYPNLATTSQLAIAFGEPVNSISLRFATVEQHIASSMYLYAFLGATQVGTAIGGNAFIPGDTYPQGSVSFSGATFDRVEVSVPPQGAEPAVAFLIDTIAVNTLGPVHQAYWPFEEATGQTATDTVAGHVGQLGSTPGIDVDDPEWTPGRTGGGLTFNGSQYVAVPHAAVLSPGTITVEAWVRSPFAPGVQDSIVAKGGNDTCSAGSYGLRQGSTGGVEFVVFGPGGALVSPESDTSVWDGRWHFVTGTFDGLTARVFVDGAQVGSGTSASSAFTIAYSAADQRLAIGSYLGGDCGPANLSYTGDVDQVGVWSGAMTGTAVAQRFAALNVPFATETNLSISPAGTSTPGESVVLSAYVWSNNGAPTGAVEFFDGTTSLGSATLVSGAGQVTVTSLALGAHTLTASFTPQGLFESSVSAPVNHTVLPTGPSATVTTLTSQPNPSILGNAVTLTATVTSSGGTPTGSVEFFDGASSLGTVTLTNGKAQLTTSALALGVHSLTAVYAPSGNFQASTSSAVANIVPPITSVTLTSNVPAPQRPLTTVTFTAEAAGGIAPYQYKFWVYNGTTWKVEQGWSGVNTFVWSPASESAAAAVTVWVRSDTNGTDAPEKSAGRSFPVLAEFVTALTLTADKASPQVPGTTVTFTSAATGGPAPTEYKWWVYDGAAWTVAKTWSTDNTLSWTPAFTSGAATVTVWARSAGNTADAPEKSAGRSFPILPAFVTALTLTPDKAPPQMPGTAVTFTAAATGGPAPAEYKWWVYDGVKWTTSGIWSTDTTFTWQPLAASGAAAVTVWARSAGNTADAPEKSSGRSFPILPAFITALTLTADKASPQVPGTTVTFTAAASGGPTPAEYKWWVYDGVKWTTSGIWSTDATFTWQPMAASGAATVTVWARSAGNTADAPERGAGRSFPILVSFVTGLTLAADHTSPQVPGTTVLFTANATGVPQAEYKWWVFDGTAWTSPQAWSTQATFTWTPLTGNARATVTVWARTLGNTADAPEKSAGRNFPILESFITGLALSTDRPAPQPAGTTITFTATATGGSAPAQYKFWLHDGAAWTVARDWHTDPAFVWTPATANAGYVISVWARSDTNTADVAEKSTGRSFPITAPPAP